jgi:RloB-like protein
MAVAKNGKLHNAERKPIEFRAIPSVPCFELWLLIHFAQTQGPIHRDVVATRLKAHWPGYAKNVANAYAITKDNLEAANRNAAQTRQQVGPLPGTDCYTEIDQLVTILLSLNT